MNNPFGFMEYERQDAPEAVLKRGIPADALLQLKDGLPAGSQYRNRKGGDERAQSAGILQVLGRGGRGQRLRRLGLGRFGV